MGGIKIISPVPEYLCTKAIPAMTGEMRDFIDVSCPSVYQSKGQVFD